MANVTTAMQATATAVQATATAIVAMVLQAVFARLHTRGTTAMVTYRVAGVPGVFFAPCAWFAGGTAPANVPFTVVPAGGATPANHTLLAYRGTVAGGKLGRASFGYAGHRGVCNVCLTLPVAVAAMQGGGLAVPTALLAVATVPASVGKATSAVVAAGNVAQAQAQNTTAVATPATVAVVAGAATAAVVAAVAGKASTASASTAAGKAAAAAVLAGSKANRRSA